jgi:hypothetical protein
VLKRRVERNNTTTTTKKGKRNAMPDGTENKIEKWGNSRGAGNEQGALAAVVAGADAQNAPLQSDE